MTRRIEESGVVCGEIGGKRDWNIVVTRDSRCLGTLFPEADSEVGDVKLFMTSYKSQQLSLSLREEVEPKALLNIPFRHLWDASMLS
jgi:hypothetical protein